MRISRDRNIKGKGPEAGPCLAGGQCGWSLLWVGAALADFPNNAHKSSWLHFLPQVRAGAWGWGLDRPEPDMPLALLPGHSAPDEVPGGEALLYEHQLGAGKFQQVCRSHLSCSAPLSLPLFRPPLLPRLTVHPLGRMQPSCVSSHPQ